MKGSPFGLAPRKGREPIARCRQEPPKKPYALTEGVMKSQLKPEKRSLRALGNRNWRKIDFSVAVQPGGRNSGSHTDLMAIGFMNNTEENGEQGDTRATG